MNKPRTATEHNARLRAQSSARQSRRRKQWSAKIIAAGWPSESAFVTAVINGKAEIPPPQ